MTKTSVLITGGDGNIDNNIETLDTIWLYVLFESLLNSYELSIIS
jgi:hypothetical protein